MDLPVDEAFTKALPKCELHAHLSGSISRTTLHEIWQKKKTSNPDISLGDPALALKPAGTFPTILSFFQIFNDYIYNLVNDRESIAYATRAMIEDFRRDGVRYLELRTTPREIPSAGITRDAYVRIVLEALEEYHQSQFDNTTLAEEDQIEVHLILSIDRTMTASQADEILDLAEKYQHLSGKLKLASSSPVQDYKSNPVAPPTIVGIDLCGNPTKGDISLFTPTFLRAKTMPTLRTTVHFAEIPTQPTSNELEVLLSWSPDRLGHAINIPADLRSIIKERKIALELCLSCNVLAEMTQGGFGGHHLGEWMQTECPIALGTDDVGVFESSLANEYFIAASEFGLGRGEVVGLARRAVEATFQEGGRKRMERLIVEFEKRMEL
jgi:adenosine deaminase